MKTDIRHAPSYAMLHAELQPGESIRAEPGSMVAQRGVRIQTGSAGGGIMKGIKRMVGGESFFVNTFTADVNPQGGEVFLAHTTPGDIKSMSILPETPMFLQAGAFMACTPNVKLDSKFQGFKGFFTGESIFFLRAYTEGEAGTLYCACYGAMEELAIEPDQEMIIDTGHLVAFSNNIDYSIDKVGGMRSLIAGGEGLVMKLRGSGTAWVQTRNIQSLADNIAPFLPGKK